MEILARPGRTASTRGRMTALNGAALANARLKNLRPIGKRVHVCHIRSTRFSAVPGESGVVIGDIRVSLSE